ncbi:helix-turn-helix domain-containing protein [Streptomyces sp. NPDC048018]|uniref:helix-turn-helix domain-containing protein n=1 Tax=Streptomyces sp. NPDC048018 TaxID=3365499 RepID=UPI003713B918
MGANQHSRPVTDEERARIRELHAQGLSRNAIARELDRSGRTISVQAAAMHLTFDRAATEAATAARKADLEEKRVILAEALTDDALRLTAQMWEPTTLHSFGGKDHTYAKKDIPEPLHADKRALMAAATAASAHSLRLVPVETDQQGLAAVDAWLRDMMGGGAPAAE